MDASFVKELRDGVKPEVVDLFGYKWALAAGRAEMLAPPTPEGLEVFSLDPFIAAVSNAPEGAGAEADEILVNVESPTLVRAVRKGRDMRGKQITVAVADFDNAFCPFDSGVKFEPNNELLELLKLTSQVKTEAATTSEDDGISQVVQVKGGVHLSKEVKVRNPWLLAPFKTFPEVRPVVVPYILRISNESSGPRFALYGSDGGRWKTETIGVIRSYLTHAFDDLGEENVTVL